MDPAAELVVVSDHHISEGKLDDFDQELEGHWVAFVESLAAQPHAVELVINGDFLDFVQATPWSGANLEDHTEDGVPLCYTQRKSRDKLAAIAAAHPEVFAVLRRFLDARPDHRITILPGNHDADFFWEKVRGDFAELVGPPPRCRFHLERHYVADGYPWLWIEHGHQADPLNRFEARGEERWSPEAPPILRSRLGEDRLYECTGTRFLIKFMNGLDAYYPFIDNVKPFSRFITIFGATALEPRAILAIGSALRYLAELGLYHRKDVLSRDSEEGAGHALGAWYESALPADRKALAARLRESGFETDLPLGMLFKDPEELERLQVHLADRIDILAGLGEGNESLLGAEEGTLALKAGFSANETEDLAKYAATITSARTVVMGHTHEPVDRPGAQSYFNTGSWTRYYKFAEEEDAAVEFAQREVV